MLIGGSSAFSRDKLDMRFDVATPCSRLSNDIGLACIIIFEEEGVTPNEVGMLDKIVVGGGSKETPLRFVVDDGIVEQVDTPDEEVIEVKDIELEGIVVTLGNSLRLISTKSSYIL